LLGFLGLVAIGHTLIVGTRRRRRELAILKTLGFERRQIRYAIAWEASLFAFASLVVGIRSGWRNEVWRSVADGVGVSNTPIIIGIGLARSRRRVRARERSARVPSRPFSVTTPAAFRAPPE
jgi:hypothetical protein